MCRFGIGVANLGQGRSESGDDNDADHCRTDDANPPSSARLEDYCCIPKHEREKSKHEAIPGARSPRVRQRERQQPPGISKPPKRHEIVQVKPEARAPTDELLRSGCGVFDGLRMASMVSKDHRQGGMEYQHDRPGRPDDAEKSGGAFRLPTWPANDRRHEKNHQRPCRPAYQRFFQRTHSVKRPSVGPMVVPSGGPRRSKQVNPEANANQ